MYSGGTYLPEYDPVPGYLEIAYPTDSNSQVWHAGTQENKINPTTRTLGGLGGGRQLD